MNRLAPLLALLLMSACAASKYAVVPADQEYKTSVSIDNTKLLSLRPDNSVVFHQAPDLVAIALIERLQACQGALQQTQAAPKATKPAGKAK